MYERRTEKLVSQRVFARRMLQHGGYAGVVVGLSLVMGMLGYHFVDHLPWVKAFVDTSMLLGGMGPVNPLNGTAAEIFAGLFALYAGLVFLAVTAIMLAPVFHRVLHAFHAEVGK